MTNGVAPRAVSADGRCAPCLRELGGLALLAALMLGGTYVASWLAGLAGLPVSRGMIFEGQWLVPSWRVFPWGDCAGMLAFMVALPLAWERAASHLRGIGLIVDGRALAFGAVGLAAACLVYALRHLSRGQPAGADLEVRVDVLAAYMLVVAVAEEFCFRGTIQRRLSGPLGVAPGVAVAAAAFVLWHGVPASAGVLAVRAGGGLTLGLLYAFSGRLLPPVLCHWALNLALVL